MVVKDATMDLHGSMQQQDLPTLSRTVVSPKTIASPGVLP